MRARLGPRRALDLTRTRLGGTQDPKGVAPGHRRQVRVAPAAVCQRGQQARVAGDVLEALGQHVDPVVVAAEPDVLDPGHLTGVLAVCDDVVNGGHRPAHPAAPRLEEGGVCRGVVRVDALGRCGFARLQVPVTDALGDEARDERHHAQAAVVPQALEHVVGHVAGVVAQGAGRGVGEHRRRLRDVEGVAHRVCRDVREVDEHAQPVHLPDHLVPERGQAAELGLVGGRVRPRHVVVVGQREVADAEGVEHPQRPERGVDAVPALGAQQRGDPALGPGTVDAGDRGRESEVTGIPRGHAVHGIHLLQRGRDGREPLQMGRHEDRPELGAHAALAQSRKVGVGRLATRDVELVPVVAGPFPRLPREVVVSVDDRVLGEKRADPAEAVRRHAQTLLAGSGPAGVPN